MTKVNEKPKRPDVKGGNIKVFINITIKIIIEM